MEGLNFAVSALESMNNDVRIMFIHNPANDLDEKRGLIDEYASYHHKLLSSEEILAKAKELVKLEKFTFNPENIDLENRIKQKRILYHFEVRPGDTACVKNGRILGPFNSPSELFTPEDFGLLTMYHKIQSQKLSQKVLEHLQSKNKPIGDYSDMMLLTNSLIGMNRETAKKDFEQTNPRQQVDIFYQHTQSPNSIKLGNLNESFIQFFATVDPATPDGQKIIAVLDQCRHIHIVAIHLLVTPKTLDQDNTPLDRFYRFVFPAELSFSETGSALEQSAVRFGRLPSGPTYTLGMDVPEAWIVRPFRSAHDLDNIKLDVATEVYAEFRLSHILVQGHATDISKQPPAGLQFVLGTSKDPNLVDTITMANLGYLQLKAHAGVWKLNIRPGKSAEVFEFESIQEGKLSSDGAIVIVSSFEGVIVFPTVKRRKGMDKEDILIDSSHQSSGMVDKVLSR